MSTAQDNYINPFDNDTLSFQVLKNSKGESSIWPVMNPVPSDRDVQFEPDTRASCITHVEKHWAAINPFQQS
ncbi:MbtH family NRPS accessory protein [Acinetobacter sp. WZC-1]|uniref:MbtH family NRPS accessory protein n=1 Tax=Acinetobacter sp. WZC-1 TaxID=3459034 RepID=UPI00403DF0E9